MLGKPGLTGSPPQIMDAKRARDGEGRDEAAEGGGPPDAKVLKMDAAQGPAAAGAAEVPAGAAAAGKPGQAAWTAGGTKWAKHGCSGDTLAIIPKAPPEAPLDEDASKKKKKSWQGFGPKDTILWAPMPAELFRAKTRIHDRMYATRFMEYWFLEHEGMPVEPPPPPLSAYAMYTVTMKRQIFEETGKFNRAKDMKKVGEAWRALPEEGEVKAGYHERFAAAKDTSARHHAGWKKALAAWRLVKAQRVADSGLPTDPGERRAMQLNPICQCDHCAGEEEDEDEAATAVECVEVAGGE